MVIIVNESYDNRSLFDIELEVQNMFYEMDSNIVLHKHLCLLEGSDEDINNRSKLHEFIQRIKQAIINFFKKVSQKISEISLKINGVKNNIAFKKTSKEDIDKITDIAENNIQHGEKFYDTDKNINLNEEINKENFVCDKNNISSVLNNFIHTIDTKAIKSERDKALKEIDDLYKNKSISDEEMSGRCKIVMNSYTTVLKMYIDNFKFVYKCYKEFIKSKGEEDQSSANIVDQYIDRDGDVRREKIALEIKRGHIPLSDISKIWKDERIKKSAFGNFVELKNKFEPKQNELKNGKYSKDYIDKVSYASIAEVWDEDYCKYLYYISHHSE